MKRRTFLRTLALAAFFRGQLASGVLLDFVPFLWQDDAAAPATYDCAETCVRMLLQWRANELGIDPYSVLSTAEIAVLWGKQGDVVSWADSHIYPHMAALGLEAEYSDSALEAWYRQQLDAGRPCIALLTLEDYGHFVVVVGYDDVGGFTVHDPQAGAYAWLSADDWWARSQGVGIAVSGFLSSAYDR